MSLAAQQSTPALDQPLPDTWNQTSLPQATMTLETRGTVELALLRLESLRQLRNWLHTLLGTAEHILRGQSSRLFWREPMDCLIQSMWLELAKWTSRIPNKSYRQLQSMVRFRQSLTSTPESYPLTTRSSSTVIPTTSPSRSSRPDTQPSIL